MPYKSILEVMQVQTLVSSLQYVLVGICFWENLPEKTNAL